MTTTKTAKATETATLIVKRTRIIGTDCVVFSAWEPSSDRRHSTITHDDAGNRIGAVGSRRIPAAVEALRPGSDERIAACDAWHAANYAEAYAAIVAECPEAADGRRSMGEIEIWS